MTQRNGFRRRSRRIVALGCAVALALTSVAATASKQQARQTALAAAKALSKHGYQYRDEYYTGLLKLGAKKVLRMTLMRGNRYVLVAGGCRDAHDIDVLLYDEHWNLISKDNSNSPFAVARVQPKWTGTFYAVVRLFRATPNGAHYVLLTGYH